MYYEEKVINGILCWRGDPHGEWHEMDYVELLNHYEVEKRQHYDYFQLAQERQNEAESLTASRNAWKKLAEELGESWLENDHANYQWRCIHCLETTRKLPSNIVHSPDCPIEQLRKLKEENT